VSIATGAPVAPASATLSLAAISLRPPSSPRSDSGTASPWRLRTFLDSSADNLLGFHSPSPGGLDIDGFANLDIETSGAHSIVHLEGANQITLANNTHLVASDFIFD
jgi:hypothetical protein